LRREYPDAPLTGVGVIVVRGEEVLVVRRGAEPSTGLWSIPGGLVELGERVRDAAGREVREETGIDVELLDLVGVFDNIVRDEEGRVRYHYVLVDFMARPLAGVLQPSSDITDARWVKKSSLAGYELTPITRRLFTRLGYITGDLG